MKPAESQSTYEKPPRLEREWRTVEAMIRIYCRDLHGSGTGCADCRELMEYAEQRLSRCPFQEEKPPCADCPIHCYQRKRREQIVAVMRHSGPRMLLRHPILAVKHMIDGHRKIPPHPKERR